VGKFKTIMRILFYIIIVICFTAMVITFLIKKDYDKLISFFISLISFTLFDIIELKVIKPFRKASKHPYLYNAVEWIIFFLFVIAVFIGSVFSKGKFIKIFIDGLYFPVIYFSVHYFRIWTESYYDCPDHTDS
jgi:di/tricarboxylate transporter